MSKVIPRPKLDYSVTVVYMNTHYLVVAKEVKKVTPDVLCPTSRKKVIRFLEVENPISTKWKLAS